MKIFLQILSLLITVLLINSCVLFNGLSVIVANKQINQSALSIENEIFEQEYGTELVFVKRGLWSMQDSFSNNSIKLYFINLLDNNLTYSLKNNQDEFVKQVNKDDKINIFVNNQFSNYSIYEKAILLIVSTSTLALMSDRSYNQKNVPNMFFNFIDSYDAKEIPNIINSQWYKSKNITITDDGIIIR